MQIEVLASVVRFVQALLAVVAQVQWELFETGTLQEIEAHAQEIGKALSLALLGEVSQRLQQRDARLVEAGYWCLKCRQRFEYSQPDQMTFETHLGRLRVWRSYLACRRCKVYFFPLDAALEAPRQGEIAPLFGGALSMLGVEVTYTTSSQLLSAVGNRDLDKSTIDRHLQRDGRCLQELERQEAEALWPYDEQGYARKVDVQAVLKKRGLRLSEPPPPGQVLVLQADGAMANLAQEPDVKAEKELEQRKGRKKARPTKPGEEPLAESAPSSFRESMQLVIYRLEDVTRKPGPVRKGKKRKRRVRSVITRKQFACVVNDPPMFPKQVNRLTKLWDHLSYPVRVLLGDGASKIWTEGREYFEPTVEILDINHARSHIQECARALFDADAKKAKSWGRRWCHHLENHGPKRLLAHLNKLTTQSWTETGSRKLKNLLEYCLEHQHRMDYPRFRRLAYPIASGAIEGANSHLFADRCRRSGQQWKRQNLQAMLALRCASRDGRWDIAMSTVRKSRAYQAPPLISTTPPELQPPPTEKVVRDEATSAPLRRPRPLDRLLPQRKLNRIIRSRADPHPLEPTSNAGIGGSP